MLGKKFHLPADTEAAHNLIIQSKHLSWVQPIMTTVQIKAYLLLNCKVLMRQEITLDVGISSYLEKSKLTHALAAKWWVGVEWLVGDEQNRTHTYTHTYIYMIIWVYEYDSNNPLLTTIFTV